MTKVLAILVLLLPTTALADSTYTLYKMPKGHRYVLADETIQGFSLEEYKELLLMDSQLKHSEMVAKLHVAQIDELKKSLEELKKLPDVCLKKQLRLEEDLERKDLLVKSLTKSNIELNESLMFRKRVIRASLIVAGGAVAGLATGLWLK